MIIDGKSAYYSHMIDGTVLVTLYHADGTLHMTKVAKSQRGANRITNNWFAKP